MKRITFFLLFLSVFYFGTILIVNAQFDDEPRIDNVWQQKGFEFYIGTGVYFASKKTADYYTGAPDKDINLNLVFNNEFYKQQIWEILKNAYPYQERYIINDNVMLPAYNIAVDIQPLGLKYRFRRNWYFDLSYSLRILTADNVFHFKFPDVDPGNIEHNSDISRAQHLVAVEYRHYIDLSLGYIFQKHPIAKPFISVGGLFTYTNIKKFHLFIEEKDFDLLEIAKYPNATPGVPDMPDYRVWAGPGYGFSATVGLKIAFSKLVSLDPFAQISVASFGNNKVSLPGFNTSLCPNYSVGVRLVICDFAVIRNK